MTAAISYHVRKQAELGGDDPEWHWNLTRTAQVQRENGQIVGFLPEVCVAQFTSEAEADLYEQWLIDREAQWKGR